MIRMNKIIGRNNPRPLRKQLIRKFLPSPPPETRDSYTSRLRGTKNQLLPNGKVKLVNQVGGGPHANDTERGGKNDRLREGSCLGRVVCVGGNDLGGLATGEGDGCDGEDGFREVFVCGGSDDDGEEEGQGDHVEELHFGRDGSGWIWGVYMSLEGEIVAGFA
jgi:hypothetical protein